MKDKELQVCTIVLRVPILGNRQNENAVVTVRVV